MLLGLTSQAVVNSFNSKPVWLNYFIAGIHATTVASFAFILMVFLFMVIGFSSGNLIFLSIILFLLGFATDRSRRALDKLSENNIEALLENANNQLITGLIVIIILLYFAAAFFVGR